MIKRGFIKFKGNFISNPSFVRSTNNFFQFGTPHNTLLASIHSNSSSNHRSKFQNITNLDDALNLFDIMIQIRPLPSVVKFTQLMNAVTKMKHFLISLDIFKRMCAAGVSVNEYSMSIAIKCCCQLHHTNEGFAVLGYCFRRGIIPNIFIFTTLLDGLILEDRILEAERLFKKLIKQKLCEPNVVMYNTMIKGFCKCGNKVVAVDFLRLMDEQGCKPDVVSYNTIIDGLCKDKMIDEAFKLFKEMVYHKNIQPNVITYTSLICGLCNLGKWDEVSKMLKQMDDKRISLDIVTYNSIIDGYCLQREMDKAKKVFDLMTSSGLIPDVITFNSLLNGYCKNLNIEEAIHMFDEMTKKGIKPNIVTYNTMIQGLFRVGNCEDACKLFDEMRYQGQMADECTYRIVLEGLCNNHKVEDALNLISDRKLNLDIIVYDILIDGATKCGRFDIAKDLFHDLIVKGLQPDVRVYTVMINTFCGEGLMRDAKQLFLKMDEYGCPPDNVTYNVLLRGYLKNRHYDDDDDDDDDVEKLLQEINQKGYSLDVLNLSLLNQLRARNCGLELRGPYTKGSQLFH